MFYHSITDFDFFKQIWFLTYGQLSWEEDLVQRPRGLLRIKARLGISFTNSNSVNFFR